jgi:pimeloyl-ACP methyl ester carboxylesterase
MWLSCAGTGSPTVVVVPGLGAAATSWQPVLPALRASVRTCVYDRPGLGRSPARPDPHQVVDAGMLAGELAALLRRAGEPGPYVVVGHSFGGLVARAFVAADRRAVRGVLLAESVTPDDPTLPAFWTEAGHPVDLRASSAAADGGPRLGRTPLLVLTASQPDRDHLGGPTYGQPAWMTALWVRQQRADLGLSEDSVQVVARSGHVLQQDDPAAVVDAVRTLVTAARTGAPLRCDASWRYVSATCR